MQGIVWRSRHRDLAHAGLGYLCQKGTMMRWGRELCDGVAAPEKCTACVVSKGWPSRSAGASLEDEEVITAPHETLAV